jgi:hypothetical protein
VGPGPATLPAAYRRRSTWPPSADCTDAGTWGVSAASRVVIQLGAVDTGADAGIWGVPAASRVVIQLGATAALEATVIGPAACHPRSLKSNAACSSAGLTPVEPIPTTTPVDYHYAE